MKKLFIGIMIGLLSTFAFKAYADFKDVVKIGEYTLNDGTLGAYPLNVIQDRRSNINCYIVPEGISCIKIK